MIFNRVSIGKKLLLTFLLIGSLPSLGIGGIAIWQIRSALSDQAYNQLEGVREIKRAQLEDFFQERKLSMDTLLQAVTNLRQNAKQRLAAVQENQNAQLNDYFAGLQNNLSILSRTEAVAQSIEQFTEALELDGGELGAAWESIKGLLDKELQQYKKTFGYDDLLLVNAAGKIVYTALHQPDLAMELKGDAHKDTPLARAVEQVLTEREPVFLDFSRYESANNNHVFFALGPVWKFDKLVGVLIFRIAPAAMDAIVQHTKDMGHSGGSYVVAMVDEKPQYRASQGHPIGTEASGEDVEMALAGKSGHMRIYAENGKLLVSAYRPVAVKGLNWGLITRMDVEEIISPRLEGAEEDFFSHYTKEQSLHDLFLIYKDGKIFYSVKHEADYGTNLFDGEYANTQLGQIAQLVMKTREFQMSDYAPYSPSNNEPASFIAQPILEDDDRVELIVAVQLSDDILTRVMLQREGLGKTGETYLVGEDFLLRSNSFLAPETHTLRTSFTDPDKRRIQTRPAALALQGQTGRVNATNYLGDTVLSTYMPIHFGSMSWALIAEKKTSEAFAPIFFLQMMMGLAMLGLMLVVGYISRSFAFNLISPLAQVNTHLKILAQGEPVERDIEYHGQDEIAELVQSARKLKNSMDATIAQANAVAQGDYAREVVLRSERDQLGRALIDMTRILRQVTAENQEQDWLKTGLAALNEKMRGNQSIDLLGKNIITLLVHHLNGRVGLFYVLHEADKQSPVLQLTASYAYTRRKELSANFGLGEGLVGQAALERELIVVEEVPETYETQIQSGTGKSHPRNIVLVPLLHEDNVKGVVEIGSFQSFSEVQLDFLNQAAPMIAIGIYTAGSRMRLEQLLAQSQAQAEELQSQSEELEVQQEELRQSNEELEERSQELERQKDAIRVKNQELEGAKAVLEQKAEELELANKYKSEFLANMSHELRTPLNSLLILAQMLSDNKENNLTDKQVKYAKTIHQSGSDLLNLINEILDLSKIEAGRVDLHLEEVRLRDVVEMMDQRFRHMMEEKGLHFEIRQDQALPEMILNDGQRLQQVLTNLLSNAFKFTERDGTIILQTRRCTEADNLNAGSLLPATSLAISVQDSGIGIAEDKQQQIFEAFQQADGSTSRKYGGTGLGLSITRQLAQLMGGFIKLQSAPGQGSTFTLYIPERVSGPSHAAPTTPAPARTLAAHASPPSAPLPAPPPAAPTEEPLLETKTKELPKLQDDRDTLQAGDKLLLVIEDDPVFAGLLLELAHKKHFKCLFAQDGAEGLRLAEAFRPHAIILDIGLPQVDGLTVVERLKSNPETRHIPIHCVSGQEQDLDARKMGAIGYLVKPAGVEELGQAFHRIESFIDANVRNLLLFSENEARAQLIRSWINNDSMEIVYADYRSTAWESLAQMDCIVVDAGSQPAGQLGVLQRLQRSERLARTPVILFAERDLSNEEEAILHECTEKLVIKSVQSPERLLDEATLFLHQVESQLPREQQQILHRIHDQKEAILAGKHVLVVDDDVRNIYSLTAILEDRDMNVLPATDGKRALELLREHPNIDIVLMDIMMPEMDGYETMRTMRAQGFKKLPIIALTAKAMKGDKAKCIDAGANDYLAKPIDATKLLTLMRVWLFRR